MVKIMKNVFLVTMMFFAPCFAQEQVRLLVPRADSPTAMVRCGAELENVKAQKNLTRQYVSTGQETLHDMQYCVAEAGEIHTAHSDYRVPAGTVGWLSEDGKDIVLEQCVNQAHCEGCPPAPPPPPPVATCDCPPPAPPPPVEVEVILPPPPEDVPLKALPPTPEPWQPSQTTVAIVWDEHHRPLWSKFPVLNCAYELVPGLGGFKRHSAGDIVEKAGCAAGIAGGIYAGVARGAATAVKIGVCVPTMLPNGAWTVCGH